MPDQADELRNLRAELESLSAQVAQFRSRLDALEQGRPAVPPFPVPAPQSLGLYLQSGKGTALVNGAQPEKLETRFGLTVINRVGAITLAIGIVFFFKYAVDNQWIGAFGRVVLGVLGGLALIGAAEWLSKRDQRVFSQGVAGCGLAILYISLYASFAYYQLVPQWGAFLCMVATCVLAAFLSLRYQSPAISALGLIGAFLTPLLLYSGQQRRWLFLLYMLALDIGALAVSARMRWYILEGLAFTGTAILFLVWTGEPGEKTGLGLFFLLVYFGLFFTAWIRVVVPLPFNAFWALIAGWVLLSASNPHWFVWFAAALAALHFAIAYRAEASERLHVTSLIIGHACLIIALTRELVVWAANNVAAANFESFLSETSSIFLAIYAIVMLARGVIARTSIDRIIGLVLIGVVIAKLYFYDVWLLTRFYRVSAFVALGILLLAASYIYSRFKDKLDVLLTGKRNTR